MGCNIIFDTKITDGGGFFGSFDTTKELAKRINCRVTVFSKDNLKYFEKHDISVNFLKLPFRAKFVQKCYNQTGMLLQKNKNFLSMPNEITYFATPSSAALISLNGGLIFTIWDLCHLDNPEFKEVGSPSEFNRRQKIINTILPRSSVIVVDSIETKNKLKNLLGKKNESIMVLPFAFPKLSTSTKQPEKISKSDKFIFYPAQYWRHKNHKNLIKAFNKISLSSELRLVLCGAKKEHELAEWINYHVKKSNGKIIELGFIENEKINWLYENCIALVYPSFFGPTNIPPLEAMLRNKPILCSNMMKNILKNNATYFDPDNVDDIKNKLSKFIDNDAKYLIKNYEPFIQQNNLLRQKSLDNIANKIERISSRLIL
jgi:glycosyltransferase involved in cell wall biosynthesis